MDKKFCRLDESDKELLCSFDLFCLTLRKLVWAIVLNPGADLEYISRDFRNKPHQLDMMKSMLN